MSSSSITEKKSKIRLFGNGGVSNRFDEENKNKFITLKMRV